METGMETGAIGPEAAKPRVFATIKETLDAAARHPKNQDPERQKAITDAASILQRFAVVNPGPEQFDKPSVHVQMRATEGIRETSAAPVIPEELNTLKKQADDWYGLERGENKVTGAIGPEAAKPKLFARIKETLNAAARHLKNQNPEKQKEIADLASTLQRLAAVNRGPEEFGKPSADVQMIETKGIKEEAPENTIVIPKELNEFKDKADERYGLERGERKVMETGEIGPEAVKPRVIPTFKEMLDAAAKHPENQTLERELVMEDVALSLKNFVVNPGPEQFDKPGAIGPEAVKPRVIPTFKEMLDAAAKHPKNQTMAGEYTIKEVARALQEVGVADPGPEQFNELSAHVQMEATEGKAIPEELKTLKSEADEWYGLERGERKVMVSFLYMALADAAIAQYQQQAKSDPNFDGPKFVEGIKQLIGGETKYGWRGVYSALRQNAGDNVHKTDGQEQIKSLAQAAVLQTPVSPQSLEDQTWMLRESVNDKRITFWAWNELILPVNIHVDILLKSNNKNKEDITAAYTVMKTFDLYLTKYNKLYPLA